MHRYELGGRTLKRKRTGRKCWWFPWNFAHFHSPVHLFHFICLLLVSLSLKCFSFVLNFPLSLICNAFGYSPCSSGSFSACVCVCASVFSNALLSFDHLLLFLPILFFLTSAQTGYLLSSVFVLIFITPLTSHAEWECGRQQEQKTGLV